MGIILFKNVKIGHVPKTPATPYPSSAKESSSKEAVATLLDYAWMFGHPISYAQEQGGQLLQNIVPVHKTESQQISTSSKVELALHTEAAFHPYKPDYVMLLCLRGDENAVTTYAHVDDIVEKLDLWVIATLSKEWFTTNIDISFRTKGEKDKSIPISVLEKTEDGYNFIYDYTFVKANDELGRAALEILHKAVQECVQEVTLQTGDLLVIDNNKTIHGRKQFQARYDGTDRWVQRILVRKDLPPADQINGHIITTEL
jgi:L-asparagine oxygenase